MKTVAINWRSVTSIKRKPIAAVYLFTMTLFLLSRAKCNYNLYAKEIAVLVNKLLKYFLFIKHSFSALCCKFIYKVFKIGKFQFQKLYFFTIVKMYF